MGSEVVVNVKEFEALAKGVLPKMYYDFYAAGAEDEHTLRQNQEAFTRIMIRPRILADVSRIDMSASVLGHNISAPIMIAPTAMHKLAHPHGELATARAASASGTIMVFKRRDVAAHLVQRAERSGYKAIVLTVDTPRLGRREADIKNKFDVNEERVNKVITHIIHSHYNGPWVSFSKVPGGPNGMKELWWKQFQNQFWWKDRHATRIKAIWRSKCSQHLRNTFWEARKEKRKPPFVSPEDWEIMKRYWETNEKFKHISETNKKSRATEGQNGFPNFTGGSKSVVEIVKEIEKESGRRMTQEELVKAMYHSKKTGKYTDNRAEKSLDDFTQLCEKWIEAHPGEEIPQEEINKLWLQATGGEGKDRIYGQGSLYRKTDNVLNQAALQAPSPIGMSSTPPPQLLVGQQPPLPPSPPPRPVAPPQPIGGLQPALPPSPLPYHPSPTPYRPLPPPYHPSPPPYTPCLPPQHPFLAQSASSSSHESEAQRQLEYYKIANQQQQDFVQQLLMQVNQGGMQRTNTSRFIPSTMQSNMSFQGLLNSARPEVNGDAPRDPSTTSSLPRFYDDE